MIDVKLEIKIDEFNGAMQEMANALSGHATKKDIVRSEVQSILQKTIDSVKVSTEANIVKSQATRPWTTMDGKKYLIYGTGKKGHRNRYPDALWNQIQAMRAEDVRMRIAAIGWGARAWLELAGAIGLTISGGKAATAKEPGRDARTYVSTSTEEGDDTYILRVTNNSRLQNWIGGRTAFFSAIAGRLNYFRQNMKHGVFSDLAAVAKKYKGITVTTD